MTTGLNIEIAHNSNSILGVIASAVSRERYPFILPTRECFLIAKDNVPFALRSGVEVPSFWGDIKAENIGS